MTVGLFRFNLFLKYRADANDIPGALLDIRLDGGSKQLIVLRTNRLFFDHRIDPLDDRVEIGRGHFFARRCCGHGAIYSKALRREFQPRL
jgi:hypothetical protein